MKDATKQQMTEDEKSERIAHLEALKFRSLAEERELDTLRGDETKFEDFDPAVHVIPKPKRARAKAKVAEKPAKPAQIFPVTALLDTETGKYTYINSVAELDEQTGIVISDPERYRIIQGKHLQPAVNWK